MKEKVGGWVQLDSDVRYENPWIKVEHQNVLRPNKSQGIYGVVHFKNNAVGVVPIDEYGNTWLVRQSRYALNQYTWEIPEGGSPVGEDPLDTAKRELKEETGIVASHWSELATMHLSNSVSDEVAYLYVARGLRFEKQELEDSEDIELRKLPLTDAIDMVLEGEITDAMSVCALLKLALQEPLEQPLA